MILFQIFQYVIGRNRAILSRAYLDSEDAEVKKEIAEAIFPFVSTTLVVSNAFRIFLVLAALKWPRICHYFYCY